MNKGRIVEKKSLLQDILEESARLQPLFLTLIDDLKTRAQRITFLGHLINCFVSKNLSRNVVLLLFGTNERQFHELSRIKMKQRIQILKENDFNLNDNFETNLQSKLISLVTKDASYTLVIDSINPFFIIFDDSNNGDEFKHFTRFYRWVEELRSHYEQVILTFHSDKLLGGVGYSNEACLAYVSNVIIDFRIETTGSEKISKCPYVQIDDCQTIHSYVTSKKKHAKTHIQVDRKHEHFQLTDSGLFKLISEDILLKSFERNDMNKTFIIAENQQLTLPQSSFRLTLTKEEQEARKNLVLPYMKNNNQNSLQKNETNANQHDQAKTESKIIYTYDKYDDFDDEDPDDDLDF